MNGERYFAVEFEAWPKNPNRPNDFRNEPFFLPHACLRDKEEAQARANADRDNYPYCTTGRVVEVEVTIKPVKE